VARCRPLFNGRLGAKQGFRWYSVRVSLRVAVPLRCAYAGFVWEAGDASSWLGGKLSALSKEKRFSDHGFIMCRELFWYTFSRFDIALEFL
jgi:hypothetical protein